MGAGRFNIRSRPPTLASFQKAAWAPVPGFTACRRDTCVAPASNWITTYGLSNRHYIDWTNTALCVISCFLRQVAYLPIERLLLTFGYHTNVYDIPDYLRYSVCQGHCPLESGATLFPRQPLIITVVWFGRPRVIDSFWCVGTVKSCLCPCRDCIQGRAEV